MKDLLDYLTKGPDSQLELILLSPFFVFFLLEISLQLRVRLLGVNGVVEIFSLICWSTQA